MRKLSLLAFVFLLPLSAQAKSLRELTDSLVGFVNSTLVPLFYALAFLMFLVGMVRYFFLEQGEEGREKGKNLMFWGLIGFTVMFSVWGIVRLLLTALPG